MDNEDKLEFDEVGLARQLEEAQEEAQTNLAGWQRAQADFENYKKREEVKQKELLEFAKEVTIVKLLPTLDALQQGLTHAPSGIDATWLRGINGTLAQLEKVLAEMGVKRINAVGKQFDPHFHEAVREVAGKTDGEIVEELQTGYELNGKVIRPSQVVISKKDV
ncbi:MAG TPA: nucleotide exchange factor GrpE [Candidatus Doudnabacteria bacterium]|nr:nucleotide exchange factor GrpE [Candidatus Doudnabacteria bacterium]